MSLQKIVDENDLPFTSQAKAQAFATKNGYGPDEYDIVPHEDGFAIAIDDGEEESPVEPPKKKEADYVVVNIQSKMNDHEPDVVSLGVNGAVMFVKRDVDVCIPRRFLEALEHTQYTVIEQKPNSKQRMSRRSAYGFRVVRDGTKKEFDEAYRKGTARTKRYYETQEDA